MSGTQENLRDAFAGEAQANRKYAVFAEKADAEDFPNVARVFRAASEAEAIHAKRLLFVLQAIKSTEENLSASIEGETDEFTTMYPAFIEQAETENQLDAAKVFQHAMGAEQVHAQRYSASLEAVRQEKDLDLTAVYLCPVCGNVELDEVPEYCPICNVPGRMFREVG
ncbi:MAG: rubrerythrin family protein [Methanomicrobiaceae archaeon]|nr:rubrerythrin family protein [Methanomicrobiaceae archaeon]